MDLRLSAKAPRSRSSKQNSGPSALGFALFMATAMGLGLLFLFSAASHKLGVEPALDTSEWLATGSTWLSGFGQSMAAVFAVIVSAGKWICLGVGLLALALTLRGIDWALRLAKHSFGPRPSTLSLSNGTMPLLRISRQDGVLMLSPSLS
ncbi:MAG: hypothetical protein H7A55_11120 [Verrucomicrobiaceae bacterium]|nr:hypothetical protein [Verrucomicrobiaceae bacterium]